MLNIPEATVHVFKSLTFITIILYPRIFLFFFFRFIYLFSSSGSE